MRKGKIAWFLLLTFGISWTIAGVFFGMGGRLDSPLALPVLLLYMIVPAVSALIVQRLIYREPVIDPLGLRLPTRRWRWFLFAIFLPPLLAAAAFGVSLLLPGISLDPQATEFRAALQPRLTPEQYDALTRQVAQWPWPLMLTIVLLQGAVTGAIANFIPSLGEELGWRGLLVREMAPLRFWAMALVIGVIWGIWHAPIIWQGYNYPEHPRIGVLMMIAFTTLFSPLFLYARLRARSVFAPTLMHATLNATATGAVLFVIGGSDLTRGLLGLAGFIVLAVANLLLLFDRRLLREPMAVLLDEEANGR